MRIFNLARGQTVYSCGESGTDMYFIASGVVQLFPDGKDASSHFLMAGDVFGETALLPPKDGWEGLREDTAVATEWCTFYMFSRYDAEQLRSECRLVHSFHYLPNVLRMLLHASDTFRNLKDFHVSAYVVFLLTESRCHAARCVPVLVWIVCSLCCDVRFCDACCCSSYFFKGPAF